MARRSAAFIDREGAMRAQCDPFVADDLETGWPHQTSRGTSEPQIQGAFWLEQALVRQKSVTKRESLRGDLELANEWIVCAAAGL